MWNEIDFGGGRLVNILQHLASAFGHGDQPGRVRNQFLHHAPLGVVGLAHNQFYGCIVIKGIPG